MHCTKPIYSLKIGFRVQFFFKIRNKKPKKMHRLSCISTMTAEEVPEIQWQPPTPDLLSLEAAPSQLSASDSHDEVSVCAVPAADCPRRLRYGELYIPNEIPHDYQEDEWSMSSVADPPTCEDLYEMPRRDVCANGADLYESPHPVEANETQERPKSAPPTIRSCTSLKTEVRALAQLLLGGKVKDVVKRNGVILHGMSLDHVNLGWLVPPSIRRSVCQKTLRNAKRFKATPPNPHLNLANLIDREHLLRTEAEERRVDIGHGVWAPDTRSPLPLLNSPRSALILLRSGVGVRDLVSLGDDDTKRFIPLHMSRAQSKQCISLRELRRERLFHSCIEEYHELCQRLSREELVEMFNTHWEEVTAPVRSVANNAASVRHAAAVNTILEGSYASQERALHSQNDNASRAQWQSLHHSSAKGVSATKRQGAKYAKTVMWFQRKEQRRNREVYATARTLARGLAVVEEGVRIRKGIEQQGRAAVACNERLRLGRSVLRERLSQHLSVVSGGLSRAGMNDVRSTAPTASASIKHRAADSPTYSRRNPFTRCNKRTFSNSTFL